MVSWHPNIVDIFSEHVSGPIVSAVSRRKVKFVNWMTMECCFVSINNSVVALEPHRAIIVRGREAKALSMKFLFTLHGSVEPDDGPHCDYHTVSILSVSNVKCCSATLTFARKKRKVHSVGGDEE